MTENETRNAQLGACVDVLPRCCDRVTLPVKFACKPELTLTFFLDYLSTRVTLSPCKQALNEESESRFNSNTIDKKQLGI